MVLFSLEPESNFKGCRISQFHNLNVYRLINDEGETPLPFSQTEKLGFRSASYPLELMEIVCAFVET